MSYTPGPGSITFTDTVDIKYPAGSVNLGSFGRLRVANPETIFDSKQLFNSSSIFWDDQETEGSGTTNTYDTNRASSILSVSNNTLGRRVRQTFQTFNYQPGKSQLVLTTWVNIATTSGITKRIGLFDSKDGLFYNSQDGVLSFVRRSSVTGSPVDEVVTQPNWNLDKLDGTGESGVTLDPTKAQIGFFDFEWLGVGIVRMGFVIGGQIIYAHQFLHSNRITSVYMSTPNLPLRSEIYNDGSGSADSFEIICSTVISEGGFEPVGVFRWISTGITAIQANSVGTYYMICGLRINPLLTFSGAVGIIDKISIINRNNDDFEWLVVFDPTLDVAPVWTDIPNSAFQTTNGEGSSPSLTTVSNLGTVINGGFIRANTQGGATDLASDALRLGKAIDGTPNEAYLIAQPASTGADILGGIRFRELV
jgi:hypothetical protein